MRISRWNRNDKGIRSVLAFEAAKRLEKVLIQVTVVSMPCWELFARQSTSYQSQVSGSGYNLAIEAMSDFGWNRRPGPKGRVIGMSTCRASGKVEDLYEHFGIRIDPKREAAIDMCYS